MLKNHLLYDEKVEPLVQGSPKLIWSSIVPSISGPKRPQDLIELTAAKEEFQASLVREAGVRGFGLDESGS